MKKTVLMFLLVLLLCTPAMAAMEYGVIYDETEMLASETLTLQGEKTLPMLSRTLGLDLRVDVLTEINDNGVIDTAEALYENYDYGYGEESEGVSLTIYLEPQDDGTYAMSSSEDWCVYVKLSQERGSSQELANIIRDAVQPCMELQDWDGSDMTASSTALTRAVDAMSVAAEAYILGEPAGSGQETGTEAPEPSDTAEEPGFDITDIEYVMDESGVLSEKEWLELESRAKSISQSHQVGVYFYIVDDYTLYGDGEVYDVTTEIYHGIDLGLGKDRNGIIVLLSMKERDYAMFVYGEFAEYAFDSYGQEKLEEAFLEDFGSNDWNTGITRYLDTCDEYLTKAEDGKPVRPAHWPWVLMMTGLSCLVAGTICIVLMRKMKTVHQKSEADAYIAAGGLSLTDQYDRYTHTTETRVKIEKESSSSESGGRGSGRSGKF